MATTPWPRHAVLATIAVAAMALTACAKTDGTADAAPTSTGDSAIGAVSTTTPDTTSNNEGQPTSTGAAAPLYPKDARSYALELLKAFSRKDLIRAGQLASQSTVVGIRDSLNAMGAPNGTWSYFQCVPDENAKSERSVCTFFNANGDQSDVTVINNQLGFPTAVYAESLMRTQIPNTVDSYITMFVGAWGDSNYQRMTVLSSGTIANYFKSRPKITSYNIDPQMTEGTKIYVRISGTGGSLGKSEVVYIDPTKISQGKANGITGYKTNP